MVSPIIITRIVLSILIVVVINLVNGNSNLYPDYNLSQVKDPYQNVWVI